MRNWSCAGGVGGEDLVLGARGVRLERGWGQRWGPGAALGPFPPCLLETRHPGLRAACGGAGMGVPPCHPISGSVRPPRGCPNAT